MKCICLLLIKAHFKQEHLCKIKVNLLFNNMPTPNCCDISEGACYCPYDHKCDECGYNKAKEFQEINKEIKDQQMKALYKQCNNQCNNQCDSCNDQKKKML